jgi:protein-disulfide isomerase
LHALESPEIEEKYKKNMALGAALKINGTPSLIVGDQIIQGYVPVDHLSSLVEKKKQEKSE